MIIGWMGLLMGGETHTVTWEDSLRFTNITYSSKIYDLHEGDYLYIRHKLASAPDVLVY